LVDLFSGCGALSLGIAEACRALQLRTEHVFGADTDPMALGIYRANFSPEHTEQAPLQSLFGEVGSPISDEEASLSRTLGAVDLLAGGPPCQGHSDLNNHTRRCDPKNALFHTMIRAVEVLRPTHMILENVPGVRHDKNKATVHGRVALEGLGYKVSENVLLASKYGVPQQRSRYFMVATRTASYAFDGLSTLTPARTLRWACEDVPDCEDDPLLDSHARTARGNLRRIDYLFDNDLHDLPDAQRPPCHRDKKHAYRSVYGRLHWDDPAPTITSGFNSPGQGRFVHPSRRRTLTPREAARIQTIPDSFNWAGSNREGLMRMIGNAVPPLLAFTVAVELLR
jgi:DNA (cytosine-5)-methyltransferase 1